MPQFHDTHADGTLYFDMPAFWKWENKQKNESGSSLAIKETVERHESQEIAVEREELREISDDQQSHQRDKALLFVKERVLKRNDLKRDPDIATLSEGLMARFLVVVLLLWPRTCKHLLFYLIVFP